MLSQFVRQKNAASQLRLLKGRCLLQSSAKLRHHSHTSRLSSLQAAVDNTSTETRRRRPSLQSSRSLATAAEPPSVVNHLSHFDNPSYTSSISNAHNWDSLFPPHSDDFSPSSLVIVKQDLMTKPRTKRRHRGVGGDEEEMVANFELAVKLAQFDRAASLLNRLREFNPFGSQAYLDLHNQFLAAMVSHVILTKDKNLLMQIQRWFEIDMPHGDVETDATTFAIMIRLALRMFHGTKRDRAVRRYWEFAKNADVEEEVLAVDVLTEMELGELSEICSSDLERVAIDSFEPRNPKTKPLDEATEVLAVEQKGLGLSSLKESIQMFSSDPLPMKNDGYEMESKEHYNERRQQQLERDVMQAALDRWRQETEALQKTKPDGLISGERIGPVINQWHTDLVVRIKEELKHCEEAYRSPIRTFAQKERCEYGLFLGSLDPERLAALTIITVMNSLVRLGLEKGVKLAAVVNLIGDDLYEEVMAEKALQKHLRAEKSAYRLKLLKTMLGDRKRKSSNLWWRHHLKEMEKEEPETVWSVTVKTKLGAVLMSLLFESAKVPVVLTEGKVTRRRKKVTMQPAFQHSYQIHWGKRSGFIHVHPQLVQTIIKSPSMSIMGRHLPMVCKPRPWTGFKDGAYFLHQSHFVRSTAGESLQPTYVKVALEEEGLDQIRQSLNILGGTGWCINRDVFDIMIEAWNSGESVADLAPLQPDLPLPPKPAPEDGYEAEKKWDAQVQDIENKRSGYHSQRCFQNLQLEIARSYLNETFYLPHNMDFRGRAYPIPPYLNQMGADSARGLLLFSEAKPLGERGLKWLKIQLSNLAGFDKASLSEREQYTMDHLDDVLDSANHGLHGRRWWLKAEDPWQCLAACIELRNALQQPVPAEYRSRLPIHQDGSCNGLQHYAALGGDKIGAQQVNLEPSDRPSDVYTGVAEFVRDVVAREAAEGHPCAKVLDGKITRKIVKQTVMTNVYGVTFMGAMKQVRKQLTDHGLELSSEQKRDCSLYIAKKIFQALSSMFTGAHDIQHWLGACANRITQCLTPDEIDMMARQALGTQGTVGKPSAKAAKIASDPTKHFRNTVIWTTPLGLPVVQPYRTRQARRIRTSFQTLNIVERDSNFTVSRRKQLQAFPPNFIHSLDATHMMLSSIACHKAGLTFSAVHDSFWTHASDVDSMNEILREAFVRMHSDDVIKRLASEFDVRYGGSLWIAKLPTRSKISHAINEHRKLFGKKSSKLQELFAEHKRQKLLKSDDPELQAQGRAMVTPASIYEQMGGTNDDLLNKLGLGASQVGKMTALDADGSEILDPVMADFGADIEADTEADVEADAEAADEPGDGLEAELNSNTPKSDDKGVWLWLPLQFPEVPKKGEWDLTRIRESKYFFS
ncbi:hypothetical protein BJY04DRAFT_214493 [Aspergillus karnatakaensis]|uniref:DNA-directed RNA polymerase n=1 Tax=Aspergillus karnatakaensis TaxID=1810916 RepID=UPI003CCCB7A1